MEGKQKHSYYMKLITMYIIDYFLLLFSCYASVVALTKKFIPFEAFSYQQLIVSLIVLFVIQAIVYNVFKLHRSVWIYSVSDELIRSLWASGATVLIWFVAEKYLFSVFNNWQYRMNLFYSVVAFGFLFITTELSRYILRKARRIKNAGSYRDRKRSKRILVVGEGTVGRFFVDSLKTEYNNLGTAVGFVDDDPLKTKDIHNGVRVIGTTRDIPKIVEEKEIDYILICMPSVNGVKKSEIVNIALSTNAEVKICQQLENLYNGKEVSSIRSVEISDLLARPEIKLDKEVCSYLTGSTVLITGGGGSIGSEISKQVAKYNPAAIIIFDIYENCAFELRNELVAEYGDDIDVSIRIGSVRDIARLREVFTEFAPDVIFHAAAHKHVPLMESSPCEAVKNNVFGTYNTAIVANEFNVKKFVLLSTDKAVNPTNVMGATKRITELVIQHMNSISDTCYAAVRFGNVLGSHGSVIPIFEKQIKDGGPVCVTHPKMERYFMTIPEAAQLVCQAAGLASGGEIFVLDMGSPVKILDLAKNMIHLSGYSPDEINIKFVGLRPGEKLYEELALESEINSREKTANNKIYVTHPPEFDHAEFLSKLEDLKDVNNKNIKRKLKSIVVNYTPSEF